MEMTSEVSPSLMVPTWLTSTIFAVILVLNFVGNMTVILIVALRRDMHTVPNIFIMSLSVSDLLIGLVALTLTIVQLNGLMPYTKTSCLLPVYFESVAITASVYSLLAVTFDRYKAVVLATRRAWALKTGGRIVVGVWLASFVYSAKMFLSVLDAEHIQVVTSKDDKPRFCNLLLEEDDRDLYYRIADFVVLFVLPIVAMSVMYTQIARRLWVKSLAITTAVSSKRRIVKFLVTNVVLFFFSWLPFYLIDIIYDSLEIVSGVNDDEDGDKDNNDDDGGALTKTLTYVVLRFLFTVLATANSVVNPVVYAYFNQNFRMELRKIRNTCRCNKVEPAAPDSRVGVTVRIPVSETRTSVVEART